MKREAFSLIELSIAVILLGIMAMLTQNYYNTLTLSKNNAVSELRSHFQIITATILQCKELSGVMPVQVGGADASNTLLNTLECSTTPTYKLDGGKNSFIPSALDGFSEYRATKNASEFYFSTSADLNTINEEALKEMEDSYSSFQYELSQDATKIYLKFYLSK